MQRNNLDEALRHVIYFYKIKPTMKPTNHEVLNPYDNLNLLVWLTSSSFEGLWPSFNAFLAFGQLFLLLAFGQGHVLCMMNPSKVHQRGT